MKVSVSILSNEMKVEDIVKKLPSFVDYIHMDIMDGKFVSNKTWTFSQVKKIVNSTSIPLDVHLMVNNPEKYIEDYALLNTHYITFHYEAVKDIDKIIDLIKSYGIKPGISISPQTDCRVLFPYLNKIDQVLIMSVNPGKSGQSFIDESLDKVKILREEIDNNQYNTIISIDGGINEETASFAKESGCDMCVSASYIHKDIINNIKTLKNI